jgi:ABC-type multidrug transport system fused ATPase/permease subunit
MHIVVRSCCKFVNTVLVVTTPHYHTLHSATLHTVTHREQYLASALRQEIGWFDTTQPGELATRIKGDTLVVQEGIGIKLARLLQFFSQFVAGFAIGFSRGWQLSLIMLSVVPFLGGAAMLMIRSLTKAAAATQKSSAEAGASVCVSLVVYNL